MINKTHYIKYIYSGILLLLIIVTIATYWNQEKSNEETKWVRHSDQVLRKLSSLLSAVTDAETGYRGYQLTHDTSFLRPYYRSVASLESDINMLDSLLLDRKGQRMKKDSLKDFIIKQYNIINTILTNEKSNINYDSGTYKLNLLIMGKENMDKIRSLVKRMEDAEEDILRERISDVIGSQKVAPFTLLLYAFFALSGVTVLFIFLTNELVKRKKTEDNLRIQTNDLKRSNEDLEQFAYVASHDLQEPLRKIRAFGDLLKVNYSHQVDEKGQDYIGRMQHAAERMQRLIDDLLSFSKVSRGPSSYSEIDLNDVIKNVLEDMETSIMSTEAKIKVSHLPHINGDASQLKRLFQNIISNAIKFRHPNRRLEIVISALNGKNSIIDNTMEYHSLSVRDNGIGFNQKYADKIFIIFQRLHNRTSYEGTGIGLAICRKIVSNHKGYITVNSKEGEGSEFIIYFPVQYQKLSTIPITI